jgi:ubiquinone/menaquinone biosynthesis C-methylase UbiE
MRPRAALTCALLAVAATLAAGAPQGSAPGVHPISGRRFAPVMGFQGADWLDRAERMTEEEPDKALDAIGIVPGSTVADVGAGSGYMTVRLAARVGPAGKVYANDIQPQMLALLRQRLAKEKITNVEPILGVVDDPKLPAGAIDLILLVDVYHEFSEPQKMLRRMRDALADTGRLVLLEYRKEDPAIPIRPEHKMSVAEAKLELEAEGYALSRVLDVLPRQHILVFTKQQPPATPLTSPGEIARQVERQLGSTDAREAAWGAYNAGAYQLTSAIPVLQRILAAPPASTDRERLALADAVLDALIQLHARVPAPVAVPYVDLRPVQTLVLLTSAADRDPALLHLLTTTSGWRWYSAANVLLQEKAPGLAPHLLATLKVRLTVIVVDGGQGVPQGTGWSIPGGEHSFENPAGYPPHARYEFSMTPQPGIIVLTAGPRTVYYSRTITPDIPDTFHDLALGAPTDADRLAYLHAMLGPGDATPLQADTNVSIRWSTSEALTQQVENTRRDLERQYRALLGVLVRDDRLTSAEAAALPSPMDVQLVDRRQDQSVPLPIIRR